MYVRTSGANRYTPLSSTARATRGSCCATCAARCAPAELPETEVSVGWSSSIREATARQHWSIISPIDAAGASV